ncbi:HTH-type transcriptional repressor CytR [Neomoorella glycerini]|uniref:HTH-type transcriptional repressor CytR n=1 Tax=Neomoorella glycerini TaxID=55779 RepID=A0A6I5ZNB1_9FIRM|nr:LacI family DNA-binding transcriptional regulator [Moorella glycerini]QGP91101.1 HTH-type transcriptional repressor CytR [Moorella glycerini]
MDIKTIAAKAGVSIATVSRALNKPEMVRPQTRARIMQIVDEMQYSPNPLAKSLLTGRTYTVALVFPTLRNPYFSQLAEGCEAELSNAGYTTSIFSFEEEISKQRTIFNNIIRRHVDGIILAGSGSLQAGYQQILEGLNIPIVVVEDMPDLDTIPVRAGISCINIDDRQGTQMAIKYFLQKGHREIGIIAGEGQMLLTRRRLEAARSVLKEAGLTLNHIVNGSYISVESGYRGMLRLLDSDARMTAVFAFNDLLAIGALNAVLDRGLQVPGDVAIIGFDDIPLAAYTRPRLSTVHSPSNEIGAYAARMLLEHIAEEKAASTRRRVFIPAKLVIRETC